MNKWIRDASADLILITSAPSHAQRQGTKTRKRTGLARDIPVRVELAGGTYSSPRLPLPEDQVRQGNTVNSATTSSGTSDPPQSPNRDSLHHPTNALNNISNPAASL